MKADETAQLSAEVAQAAGIISSCGQMSPLTAHTNVLEVLSALVQ